MNRKEYAEKIERYEKLSREVEELWGECTDRGVEAFFDLYSDKLLSKKVKVLKALNDGKSPDEIGKDYYDILEKLDVPEGQIVMVGNQILDPHKYD